MRLVPERSAYQRHLAFLYALLGSAAWVAADRGWIWAADRYACPLLEHTGIACLTCGGVRAALALGHGRPAEAFLQNPLVALALVVLGVWLVAATATTLAPSWRRTIELSAGEARVLRGGALGLVAATWIYEVVRHLR